MKIEQNLFKEHQWCNAPSVLAEAVTQFQAQAYKELLPGDGPVRTQVIGIQTPATRTYKHKV